MTIGIEATKAYEKEKTGVGWYTFYIVQELAELIQPPHRLKLYVNPDVKLKTQNSKLKTTTKNLKLEKLHWPLKNLWTQLRLSWEMLTNPPDVLFIPAHLPPLYHPRKLVVTIHDLAFKQYPEVYSKKEMLIQEFGIRRVLKKAWRIIVPSEFTKNEIYRCYPWHTKNNIFVIPHGVEQEMFKSQKSKVKSQNHNQKLKSIVYVGRLESKKNIVNLIKAFNDLNSKFKIQNYNLTLIGQPGYGYETIKKEINASLHKNNITQTGWLDREETAKQMLNAAVFVFPSLYEGFGLPILEGFAAGAPVACSNIPSLLEAGNGIPVYFDPHNPKDIAEKIAALLENETLQKQKIAQGLSYARSRTWRATGEKTLPILTH